MALPVWKVLLLQRSTYLEIGEFTQFSTASYSKKLNSAGSGQLSCSLDDPIASSIMPLSTILGFERNGTLVWSGPIINREINLPARTVTVQAVGFFDVLMKRVFREYRTVYTDVDAGQIVASIVSTANAQSPTGIVVTSVETTVKRSVTMNRFVSMGSEIQKYSQVENGYDFEVVNNEMRIYAKQGTDRSASASAGTPLATLGVQAGPQNVASFSYKIDTANFTNRFNVVTTGSIEAVEDSESVLAYGLYETSESLPSVSADVARAYASAEIAVRGLPMETISVALHAVDETDRVPRFDGNSNEDTHFFGLGDTVRVMVQDPSLPSIDQGFRVFGATVSLDASGAERITDLQVAAPLRADISTTGMVFRDTGGIYTSSIAGNPTDTIVLPGSGYDYTVSSIPYVNVPVVTPWVVGDNTTDPSTGLPTNSVLGVSTYVT